MPNLRCTASARPMEPPPLPDARSTGPPAAAAAVCLNCGVGRLGDYCHACGQHHREDRLTLGGLARQVATQMLMMEQGLLHTVVAVARSPGALGRAYVSGRRRSYTNPLTFFLIAVGLRVAAMSATGMPMTRALMEEGVRHRAYPYLTEAQSMRMIELTLASFSWSYAYQALAIAVRVAVAWRMLFRRSGVTVAEAACRCST